MVKLTLYGVNPSPPVRAVKLTLAALQLPYEFVNVNISGQEQLSEEYLKKNPEHTVPTLEDDGNYIWDSHAIIAYLVSKYADSDALYPRDLLQRAVVDQRLHFETGVVFANGIKAITKPLFFNCLYSLTGFPRNATMPLSRSMTLWRPSSLDMITLLGIS